MTSEHVLAHTVIAETPKSALLGVRVVLATATDLVTDDLYPSDNFDGVLQLGFDHRHSIEALVGIEKFMDVRLRYDLVAEGITRLKAAVSTSVS